MILHLIIGQLNYYLLRWGCLHAVLWIVVAVALPISPLSADSL